MSGTKAAIIRVKTGRRALQLISGATSMVARRSRGLSIVRVAMIPGMAQANELSSGMKDFPWSPKRPHDPVHDECRAGHVPRLFEQADEQEHQQDLREEGDHR